MRPIPVLITLLLTGCTPPQLRPPCPTPVQYSPEEERAVARELDTHPDLKEASMFILDYGNERREIRAACHQSPP